MAHFKNGNFFSVAELQRARWRMVEDEMVGIFGKGQTVQGFIGQLKNFGLFSVSNGKTVKHLKRVEIGGMIILATKVGGVRSGTLWPGGGEDEEM